MEGLVYFVETSLNPPPYRKYMEVDGFGYILFTGKTCATGIRRPGNFGIKRNKMA